MLHPVLEGVSAVLFDAGGTLVHPDYPRLALIATEETGRAFEADELGRALKRMLRGVSAELASGREPAAEERQSGWVFRRMYRELGLEEAVCQRLHARVQAAHGDRHMWCGVDPEAAAVLDALRRRGLKIAVISNTEDGRLEELIQLVALGAHFDFLIDSHVVGLRKPDAEIFQLALGRLGLRPHEAVYVGDSYAHDALAAIRVGMRAVLLDPLDLHPESVCPRIRSLGELVGEEASAPA